jgi:hypothetical protein
MPLCAVAALRAPFEEILEKTLPAVTHGTVGNGDTTYICASWAGGGFLPEMLFLHPCPIMRHFKRQSSGLVLHVID